MLKKEARILGLSATTRRGRTTFVVGAVFRGRFWLDGLLTCSLESGRSDHISKLSRAIKKSRQYSQLHAVILSRERLIPGRDIDIANLARKLRLPVILVIKKRSRRIKKGSYDLVINGKNVSVLACGISPGRVEEIFTVACAGDYPIPEATRVTDLIAEQVTLKWNSLGLG